MEREVKRFPVPRRLGSGHLHRRKGFWRIQHIYLISSGLFCHSPFIEEVRLHSRKRASIPLVNKRVGALCVQNAGRKIRQRRREGQAGVRKFAFGFYDFQNERESVAKISAGPSF